MATGKVLGDQGEKMAMEYLKKKGYEILAANYRVRGGELDLVATQGKQLVFCEVKTRNSLKMGLPIEAVNREKQRRILRAARCYILWEAPAHSGIRFDVIQVMPGSCPPIMHTENAFGDET
ncbi:MAG: YraN family protein [Alphaproteobacteria bacterium]|nr:YraN family protein [Alphaproteobacteria bacterium]